MVGALRYVRLWDLRYMGTFAIIPGFRGGAGQCTTNTLSNISNHQRNSKKALLIAISKRPDYPALKHGHRDIYRLRDLLIQKYQYASADISILADDGLVGHLQPTRNNILLAIAKLVKNVKDGDNLFFHYDGYCKQISDRSNNKGDGLRACLIPMDGENMMIMDHEFHTAMIKPLPAGANLLAILDTCRSGAKPSMSPA
ncbi:caspase domain-containing protein [Mycena galericulata]|nr:caspase domain-containing protein [Mycena galericulata]